MSTNGTETRLSLQVKDIFYDFIVNHYDVIIDTETSQLRYIFGGPPLAFQYSIPFLGALKSRGDTNLETLAPLL